MLTHKGTQVLRTERLTLRPFRLSDAEAMFRTWANDERVTRFLTWQPHGTPEVTRTLLETWCAAYAEPTAYNWAIELPEGLAGNISVVDYNEQSERASLGYCLGADFWNRGIMTEAARAVTDFLFAEVGFHRLEITHAVKNPASGRVARKCGMTQEGVWRDGFKTVSGEFLDIALYGILRGEWEARKIAGGS